jgi:chromate transporter
MGPLRELALLFVRLGFTAFGGPAVHVAMMEEEVVRRRKWMTEEKFLDLLGMTNLIPGPNSTEMAIHIGHQRAGFPGLVVAGSAFILPAALITSAFAWAYVKYGSLPRAGGLLYGVKPVVIAIVAHALYGLGKKAVKDRWLAALAVIAAAAAALGVNELGVLFGSGLAVIAFRRPAPPAAMALVIPSAFSLPSLFLAFAKIGCVIFGSGYVLLAFIRADLVQQRHWLTESQLVDAIAVGQITPGPVFTTATFIGYVLGRSQGAALATAGIFLPAFVFVALSGPLLPRIRRSPAAGAFLDGVNVASLALMAVVTAQLARASLIDPLTIALAIGSAVVLLRWKVNPTWIIATGATIGLARGFLRG